MPSTKYWTRERIIAAFLKWNKRYGRAPYSTEWFRSSSRKNGRSIWPSTSIVQREFRSWRQAVHEAGLEAPPRRPCRQRTRVSLPPGYWTKEKVTVLIQEWFEEHRSIPAVGDWRGKAPIYPDPSIVIKLFGNWNTAIEEAGFVPRPKGVTTTQMKQYKPLLGNRPESARAPAGAGADREET